MYPVKICHIENMPSFIEFNLIFNLISVIFFTLLTCGYVIDIINNIKPEQNQSRGGDYRFLFFFSSRKQNLKESR